LALIRRISRLFHISDEEEPRLTIITRNISESEIKKFENDIEKKKNEEEKSSKIQIISKNPPNET